MPPPTASTSRRASGLTGDAVMAALDSDFVDTVTKELRPGMTALIVEADEKEYAAG